MKLGGDPGYGVAMCRCSRWGCDGWMAAVQDIGTLRSDVGRMLLDYTLIFSRGGALR